MRAATEQRQGERLAGGAMTILSASAFVRPNGDEAENFEQLLVAAQLHELAQGLRAGKHRASLSREARIVGVATGKPGATHN